MDYDRDGNRAFPHGFSQLLALRPITRVIAGGNLIIVGAGATFFLWEAGVIWGLTLFLVAAGICLTASGLLDHVRLKRREAYVASVLKRQNDIVLALVEAKKQGRNPVRVLNEQKIHDFDLREHLMQAMEERLQAEGSSKSTPQKPEPTPPQS